jgi:hypothetical protein
MKKRLTALFLVCLALTIVISSSVYASAAEAETIPSGSAIPQESGEEIFDEDGVLGGSRIMSPEEAEEIFTSARQRLRDKLDAAFNAPGAVVIGDGQIVKGDNPPSLDTTLPYTAIATFSSYVYTNRMFSPNSNGRISTTFNASTTDGSQTSVIIRLYRYNGYASDTFVESKNLGYASGWTDRGDQWNNLSTDYFYYFKIEKTAANTLSVEMECF